MGIINFSCAKDNDNPSNNNGKSTKADIVIKAYPVNNNIAFSVNAKKFTIDWGDGTTDVFDSDNIAKTCSHNYANNSLQSITITAEVLTKLSKTTGDVSEIVLKKCPDLYSLTCENNTQLNTIDLSNCPNLMELYCMRNQIASLTIPDEIKPILLHLRCDTNKLKTLDVSECVSLITLRCADNQLTELSLSNCQHLQVLRCHDNQLNTLHIPDTTILDVIWVENNQFTNLDISKCIHLQSLWCDNNNLVSLDIDQNSKLFRLSCVNSFSQQSYLADFIQKLPIKTENAYFRLSGADVSFIKTQFPSWVTHKDNNDYLKGWLLSTAK